MNNNSANVVEDGAVKLPIEEKYQNDGSFPSQNVTQQYSSGAQKKINRIS